MAIVSIPTGSVVTNIPVKFTAIDIAEVQLETTLNAGFYSNSVFKLNDGSYLFVDNDDNFVTLDASTLNLSKILGDGPLDITSKRVYIDHSGGNTNNLDPLASGNANNINVLILDNTSGNVRQIRGIVAPTYGKVMLIYNEGTDIMRLRANNVNAIITNRFDIDGNHNIQPKSGVWVFYDMREERWRKV